MTGVRQAPPASQLIVPSLLGLAVAGTVWAAIAGGLPPSPLPSDLVTLSIVGTSDLHGEIFPRNGRGGLAVFAGYVNNLRAVRDAEGGAVLLIDAGDTFQGGIESNLSEGAVVVDAYNAMGYAAAAIGNHEFDFGAVDPTPPELTRHGDPRGALKAIAARARFPFLAANLLDKATGRPVDWPNVAPSALIDVAGIKVGIVGIMTADALRATLVVNTRGLEVAPLVATVSAEASKLRDAGAGLVIVAAHAGGRCDRFDEPTDLSSCEEWSEIFDVARRIPAGLVDVIVAGHVHAGLAHIVSGVGITESFSGGLAFGRVDVTVNRRANRVVHVHPFPPREICAQVVPEKETCGARDGSRTLLVQARYEGGAVAPDPQIVASMAPELERVRRLQAVPLGVTLDTTLPRAGDLESPLGNLFADAMRESTGADVSVHNNGRAGLRADVPAGPLTFGRLYDAFPFDNRLVTFALQAADLARVFVAEIERGRRGALGISGLGVRAGCDSFGLQVGLVRDSGQPVAGDERLLVVTSDMLALGSVFARVAPPGGFDLPEDAPIAREVVADWLRRKGGHLRAEQFVNAVSRRWQQPAVFEGRCIASE